MLEVQDSPRVAREHPGRWTVFALVATGVFMATLDTSIVNVSLPAIAQHFDVPAGLLVEWVALSYLVVVAALLLTVGKLADVLGRRPVWTAGMLIFTLGSALCGASQSLPMLIAARAVQGVGGALLMAVGPALLVAAFPKEQRGRAMGLNAVVVGVGVSAGPVLGGILSQRLGFRAIFYVNLPIGLCGALLAWRALPSEARGRLRRFDWGGAVLLALAFATLTTCVSLASELGWLSSGSFLLATTALISSSFLLVHESRHPDPILDLTLFRDRVFASAASSLTLSFLASFALSFLLPLYFRQLRGLDLERAGLLLTPLPLTAALLAPLSGALSDRVGSRGLASIGMALLCVALLVLAAMDAETPIAHAVVGLVMAGVGQAIFRAPNNSALMGAAPPNRQGVAGGLLASARVLGQSLSIALAGAVFSLRGSAEAGRELARQALGERAPDAARHALEARFLDGFRGALWALAGVAALAALTSLTRGPAARRPSSPELVPLRPGEERAPIQPRR